ncbi:hypothetical protein B0J14DRAFT_584696 [Halenospora varia]|nr:hypothetical protein B0J14DRAFT_584696 [Halenospora varia]
MIGTTIWDYIFIRSCVFFLHSIAPLSILYCLVASLVHPLPFHISWELEAWVALRQHSISWSTIHANFTSRQPRLTLAFGYLRYHSFDFHRTSLLRSPTIFPFCPLALLGPY